ncbi:MAG: biosynthetic peptidoglycan transglycosylase [Dermatophilaceae bacterium]
MGYRNHPWRRRVLVVLGVLVLAPILGVAILWPLTPSVAGAEQLVRARLSAQHAPELAALPRPDRVGQALIATEDSRFFWTPGIDPISVVRAGIAAVTRSGETGGATLEQQLAKNLYFPHDEGLVSKVREAELALKLDASYSKNDVLRMYLADVYFGHGLYGLPAAAHGYFGMTPAQLRWPQASMLAGLVQAPSAYDPISHLSAGRQRQRHVLDRLVSVHVLSAAQAGAAYAAPLGLG